MRAAVTRRSIEEGTGFAVITICCTQKVLRRLRIADPQPISMPPTNALGNWYVNLIYLGHTQLVIASSERSLLTVLLPAADLRNSLVVNLHETTNLLLRQLGVDPDSAQREAQAMTPALIARTESRSVLASMNDFSLAIEGYRREGRTWMEIMLRFAATPKAALAAAGGPPGNPLEITNALLEDASRRLDAAA